MPAPAQRAAGRLDLAFRQEAGRTRLERLYQQGCLKACLPRASEMEVVALNLSGGIVGGDRLETTLNAGAGAEVTFTTQAAERLYRTLDAPADVATRLHAGRGARLHYLPQETILFDRFALKRTLEVELHGDAEFLGLESLVFGRLAMGEAIHAGMLRDRISLRRDGKLLWQDITRLDGDIAALLARPAVAGGARAVASLFGTGKPMAERLPALRAALAGAVAGASWNGEMLTARILAPDAAALRAVLARALHALRGTALPRVWQIGRS
jgi:urease accessory protein